MAMLDETKDSGKRQVALVGARGETRWRRMYIYVCVCVKERKRGREREKSKR